MDSVYIVWFTYFVGGQEVEMLSTIHRTEESAERYAKEFREHRAKQSVRFSQERVTVKRSYVVND